MPSLAILRIRIKVGEYVYIWNGYVYLEQPYFHQCGRYLI